MYLVRFLIELCCLATLCVLLPVQLLLGYDFWLRPAFGPLNHFLCDGEVTDTQEETGRRPATPCRLGHTCSPSKPECSARLYQPDKRV